MKSVFGINNSGKIELNEYGLIAHNNWMAISNHFYQIELNEFVIMPNNVHGVFIIKSTIKTYSSNVDSPEFNTNYKIECTRMYLSKVIQLYKVSVTSELHLIYYLKFKWQRSFYNHVVRDEIPLFRNRKYIKNNPVRHFKKSA